MAVTEADAIKDLTGEEVEDLKETFRTFDKMGATSFGWHVTGPLASASPCRGVVGARFETKHVWTNKTSSARRPVSHRCTACHGSGGRLAAECKDGSGEIDLDELRTVMTSLGYSPTNKQLEDMMAKVDLDGNGLINFAEFVTMMRKCKVDTDFDRQIREAFKFFDQDGSGAIDTKELGNIMRQLGAKLTDSEINLLVQEADVDGDGQVDINEASDFVSDCFFFLV
ncbi:unnamed protein product [Ectocarpus sp. 8 AP-2014]